MPSRLPSGEIQLPNGRLLTPTGAQTEVSPYPFALALTPDGTRVVALCTGADDQSLHLLDAASGKLLFKQPLPHSWFGLALSPDGARVYVAGAKGRNVLVYRLEGDRFVAGGADLAEAQGGRARRWTRRREALRFRRTAPRSGSRVFSRTTS